MPKPNYNHGYPVGHYVRYKDPKNPDARKIVEVTKPGHMPSKDYPFRHGRGYTKDKRPDPGYARVVVQNVRTGGFSWPRCKEVWYLGTDPDGPPLDKNPVPAVAKNIGKVEGLTLLCEDLITLFHHSHMDEPLHEVQEVLQPYRERLQKIKDQ